MASSSRVTILIRFRIWSAGAGNVRRPLIRLCGFISSTEATTQFGIIAMGQQNLGVTKDVRRPRTNGGACGRPSQGGQEVVQKSHSKFRPTPSGGREQESRRRAV